MIALFARLEITRWRRDRGVVWTLVAASLAVALAAAWATVTDIDRQDAQVAAAADAREAWEGRGAIHPHRMAHFGDYVFRPSGPLARLDRGVQARLGNVLRVEAHKKNTPLHANADDAGTLARFARPDSAFLMQTIVPLLLIFLGGTGLATDRESGRLKLSIVQGARAAPMVLGRFIALWGVGLALLLLVVAVSLGTSAAAGGATETSVPRLAGFVGVHALYLAVVAAGVVAAAVWLRDVRSALLALLAAWVVATAILPRVTAGLVGAAWPLPSQDAFQSQLEEARSAGPDGHNPRDETLAQLRQQVLDEYGVETADQLPIDIGGIMMQADEDFGNQVWDEHYGELQRQLEHQAAVSTQVSVLNPYQAVDALSMALAGTDLTHDLAFQRQAEDYRRELVANLNDEHAHGRAQIPGSRNSSAAFFAGFDTFAFEPPAAGPALRPRLAALFGLFAWAGILLATAVVGARRVERGSLPC